MNVSGRNIYTKEILYLLTLIGVWPARFPQSYKSYLHAVYSKASPVLFAIFVLMQFMEMFHVENLEGFIENLSQTLLYVVTSIKVFVSKSQKLKKCVKSIREYEKRIANEQDGPKVIYTEHVNFFHKIKIFICVVGVLTTVPFFVSPFIEDSSDSTPLSYLDPSDNRTWVFRRRPLPISSWVPFDKYRYYRTTFSIQVIGIMYGASSTVFTDIFIVGFMLFLTLRIRVLKYHLGNVRDSGTTIDKIVRRCVIEHQDIIRNVKELDEAIRMLMLIDCIICSLQIAAIMFWIVVSTSSQIGVGVIYLNAMVVQLFIFYGFANNIMVESLQLSSATWNSNWYNCSTLTKRSLLLIMLGCKKPLKLSVGTLYPMSNEVALTILKTAYSYVALFFNVYRRNR